MIEVFHQWQQGRSKSKIFESLGITRPTLHLHLAIISAVKAEEVGKKDKRIRMRLENIQSLTIYWEGVFLKISHLREGKNIGLEHKRSRIFLTRKSTH